MPFARVACTHTVMTTTPCSTCSAGMRVQLHHYGAAEGASLFDTAASTDPKQAQNPTPLRTAWDACTPHTTTPHHPHNKSHLHKVPPRLAARPCVSPASLPSTTAHHTQCHTRSHYEHTLSAATPATAVSCTPGDNITPDRPPSTHQSHSYRQSDIDQTNMRG
jgi:hypothetical protein